jgi:hypothetical protein
VTIPATNGPGRPQVIHSDFTVPYRNKQQSPSTVLPRFKLVYVVTPGPTILPPACAQVYALSKGLRDPGHVVAAPRFASVGASGGEQQRLSGPAGRSR